MDITTLRAVLWDLRRRVLPSRFEKAQQPDPATVQLGLRSLKGMIWLELSWRAEAARLTQVAAPPRGGSGSTLAQQLQHTLRQLALVELHQNGFERIVEFRFAHRPGEPVQKSLVLELMGRHSNLLLLDEQRKVIALGRQVRDHQSRVRPISTGDPYSNPPPLQGRAPDRDEPLERWQSRLCLVPVTLRKALQQSYQGISPALALQLAGSWLDTPVQELTTHQWDVLNQRWSLWLQQLSQENFQFAEQDAGSYCVWGHADHADPKDPPLALQLGMLFKTALDERSLQQMSAELRQRLQRWRSKEKTALDDQSKRLNATSNHRAVQQKADALLCLQNPSRDQVDEAQKLYQKARKLRRSVPLLQDRINHHQQRLQLIAGSETFIDDQLKAAWEDCAPRLQALAELRDELDELLQAKERGRGKRQKRVQNPKPLELTTDNGMVVQVGRNHRQNDWISLRQARQGDLWFHAQECPGSHVVLKSSNGLGRRG